MSSEPHPTWPPEGLGWPGLCTLACPTGMPVGDQASKPKRHCFRPPAGMDSQDPGFRVNTRSSRVTTQVNQPHSPDGWTHKEPPQVMAREPSIQVDLTEWGGVSADTQGPGQEGWDSQEPLMVATPTASSESYKLCPFPLTPPSGLTHQAPDLTGSPPAPPLQSGDTAQCRAQPAGSHNYHKPPPSC